MSNLLPASSSAIDIASPRLSARFALLAEPAVVRCSGRALPTAARVLGGVAIEAARDACRDLVGTAPRLRVVDAAARGRPEWGAVLEVLDVGQVQLWLDLPAARALIESLAETSNARGAGALQPRDLAALEFVALGVAAALERRTGIPGAVAVRSFTEARHGPAVAPLAGGGPQVMIVAELALLGRIGSVTVLLPAAVCGAGWNATDMRPADADPADRANPADPTDQIIEVVAALPPFRVDRRDLARLGRGDALAVSASRWAPDGAVWLATSTGWLLGPARVVQDTGAVLRLEATSIDPRVPPWLTRPNALSGPLAIAQVCSGCVAMRARELSMRSDRAGVFDLCTDPTAPLSLLADGELVGRGSWRRLPAGDLALVVSEMVAPGGHAP